MQKPTLFKLCIVTCTFIFFYSHKNFKYLASHHIQSSDFLELETFDAKEVLEDRANWKRKGPFITKPSYSKNARRCPIRPKKLDGNLNATILLEEQSWSQIEAQNQNIVSGGTHVPKECIPRHRVAIIIPLRDRELHLRVLLAHMHPIWQRQQIEYKVFVITQVEGSSFNRAKLLNIGVAEAKKGDFKAGSPTIVWSVHS